MATRLVGFRSRTLSVACSFGLLACLSIFSSPAIGQVTTEYYWDINPDTLTGGNNIREGNNGNVSGTIQWNNTAANFTTDINDSDQVAHSLYTTPAGSPSSIAATAHRVRFGGANGGIITISATANTLGSSSTSGVGVNALFFDPLAGSTNYTLTGSNIRFINTAGGEGGSINVASGVTATINSAIQGSTTGGISATSAGTAGNIDTQVLITGGGTLNVGGGNGSLGFDIDGGTTVNVTGGSFSGFNLNSINNGSIVRTTANRVLQAPSSFTNTAGAGTLDLGNTTQVFSTLGGAVGVTNANANGVLGLTLMTNGLTHTGVISNGTGKLSLATLGAFAQSSTSNNTQGFATQTLAGPNTYTGFTSLGRGTLVLAFSNAAAPQNILYNEGFGTPTGDDGKLIISRPTISIAHGISGSVITTANSAVGSLSTLTLAGKDNTTNSQQFNGLKLTGGAANILINPTATANTVTLNLGSTIERSAGSLINFATTNGTTALSASATILSTGGTANGVLKDANGVAFAVIGGRDWAAKDAANTNIVAATYTNSTSSAFTPDADIRIPVAGAAGNDVRLSADTTISTLTYANSARSGVNLGGAKLTTGGILLSQANTSSGNFISNGTVTSPGASGSDIVLYSNTSNFFGLNAVLADGLASTGYTQGGSGTVIQNRDNMFTGTLTVNTGGLVVRGTNAASEVHINGSQTNLTGIQLPSAGNNTTGTYVQLGNADANGSLGSGSVNLGVGALLGIKRSDNVTLNNTLGAGGITQGWSGTTTLLSESTLGAARYNHVGDTTVTAGTLKLDYSGGNFGILSDSSRLVLGGGTVEFAAAAGGTAHNEEVRSAILIAGASTITKTGSGAGRLRLNAIADVSQAGSSLNITADGIADTDTNNSNGILGGLARITVGNAGNYDWATSTNSGAANTAINAFNAYTALATTAGTDTSNSIQALSGTSTFTGSRTTNSLKLTNGSGSSQVLDIAAGNTLTLASGGLLITGADAVAISNGTLRSNTATNSDLIIHQYNTGGLTIGSVIANGTGTSTLTKAGNGSLTLTGSNTYTGSTYLNGGTTSISASNNLGTGGTLFLNNGTLQTTGTFTNSRAVTLNGIGGTFDVTDANVFTNSGSFTGPGGLTKTGTGVLVMSNSSNTYSGPTNVLGGTLRFGTTSNPLRSGFNVGASGTLELASGSNMIGSLSGEGIVTNIGTATTLSIGSLHIDSTFSGQITNATNALGIDKMGAGTLTLTGSLNSYTGTTTISGGTLALAGTGVLPTGSAVNISSAAASFDIAGLSGDGASIASLAGISGSQVTLGDKTLTIAGAGSTTYAGVISGAGGLTINRSAAANQTLSGANTYNGVTTITRGTIIVASNTALGSTIGNTVINATGDNATSGRLILGNTAVGGVTIDENILLQGAGDGAPSFLAHIAAEGGSLATPVSSTINGTVTLNSITNFRFGATGFSTLNLGTITRTDETLSGSITFSASANGIVAVSNAINNNLGGITVHGGGMASLDASNNDIGNVSVANNSTLRTTADNALSTIRALSLGQGSSTNSGSGSNNDVGTYIFNANTQTLSALNGFANGAGNAAATSSRLVTSTTNTIKELIVGNTNATGVFDGVISNGTAGGTTSFTKVGTGSQTFLGTAANTYSGITTVSGGSLILAKDAGVNSIAGNVVIGDGAGTDILQLTNSNQIADSSMLTFNGTGANAGIFRLNNASETISGLSSVGGAGIIENGNAAEGTSVLTSIVASGSQTFSGILRDNAGTGSGILAFTKDGAGTQILTGNHTYTGATTVSAGTLEVNGSLANTSGITLVGGAMITGSGDIGGPVFAGGTLQGSGTYGATTVLSGGVLTGTGSYGATTILDGGTLRPGNSPGTTSFTSLVLSTGSIFEWELTENTSDIATASFDRALLSNALTVENGATSKLAFGSSVNWASPFWTQNQTWSVFSGATSLSAGNFLITDITSAGPTQFSNSIGSFAWVVDNNDLNLAFTAVPEPSSIALLLVGGTGAIVARYRRRRANGSNAKNAGM